MRQYDDNDGDDDYDKLFFVVRLTDQSLLALFSRK